VKSFRRRYPSKVASVPKARRDVAAFARGCGLLPSDISDIALAVGEACNNAAEHGHVAEGAFDVSCSYENGELVVEIADRGSGFDPHGKGECQDPENLGMRGLGIFIMRSLMDDICFTPTATGTSVRLIKYALRERPGEVAYPNGQPAGSALGAVHERLKALLKLARVQPGQRRQR
jgi:anti-sigma regulatory factor (Ser/Thr protein kinase)